MELHSEPSDPHRKLIQWKVDRSARTTLEYMYKNSMVDDPRLWYTQSEAEHRRSDRVWLGMDMSKISTLSTNRLKAEDVLNIDTVFLP